MSKISMAKAARMFAVSRPTLAKHREKGKITGEKLGEAWQFDTAELARVYPYRDVKPAGDIHAELSSQAGATDKDLQGEIKLLQAKLEAEQQARALLERHLEDLRQLLPGPEDRPVRRRWWQF